jgi:hypothetical protein
MSLRYLSKSELKALGSVSQSASLKKEYIFNVSSTVTQDKFIVTVFGNGYCGSSNEKKMEYRYLFWNKNSILFHLLLELVLVIAERTFEEVASRGRQPVNKRRFNQFLFNVNVRNIIADGFITLRLGALGSGKSKKIKSHYVGSLSGIFSPNRDDF